MPGLLDLLVHRDQGSLDVWSAIGWYRQFTARAIT
jgi:hypothetical protein